jgi:hypothetical protein
MPPAGPPLGRRPVVLLCLATVALHAAMLAVSRVSDQRLVSCEAPYAEPDTATADNKGKENAAFVMLMGPLALGEVNSRCQTNWQRSHCKFRACFYAPARLLVCPRGSSWHLNMCRCSPTLGH